MGKDNFAAFILTHGRPDHVVTYDSLRNRGYTGKIYFVIDNEDKTADQYFEKFGDQVLVFDKLAESKTFDTADNFNDRRAIVYARNVCFKLAKELGIDYFIQLDDDYTNFQYRYNENNEYDYKGIRDLDTVFSIMLDFLIDTGVKSFAMAQGGDFIGGAESTSSKYITLKRKCMNTFICSTKNPFTFLGAINEDVNTYTREASTGALFFTTTQVSIVQKQTQSNSGGMTDIYLDGGTYKKSFYTILYMPSSVKIAPMGDVHPRLHHRISWNNTVPRILDEKYKKVKNPIQEDFNGAGQPKPEHFGA